MFWLGGDDSLMIDESQEINRNKSKDSKEEMNCGESSANSNKEDTGTPTAIAGSSSRDHPDTPYPYLIYNEKPNSEIERV